MAHRFEWIAQLRCCIECQNKNLQRWSRLLCLDSCLSNSIDCFRLHRLGSIQNDKALAYRKIIRDINRRYDPHFDCITHIERRCLNNGAKSKRSALKQLLEFGQSWTLALYRAAARRGEALLDNHAERRVEAWLPPLEISRLLLMCRIPWPPRVTAISGAIVFSVPSFLILMTFRHYESTIRQTLRQNHRSSIKQKVCDRAPDLALQVLNAPPEFRLGKGVFRVAIDLCNNALKIRW
ncbi:hypothetical protein [Roseobacter sp.]|uniref:hypothetical protein n=1 Tax=Roseobacter sp. TaxID=1907202 RepID=UPI00329936F9